LPIVDTLVQLAIWSMALAVTSVVVAGLLSVLCTLVFGFLIGKPEAETGFDLTKVLCLIFCVGFHLWWILLGVYLAGDFIAKGMNSVVAWIFCGLWVVVPVQLIVAVGAKTRDRALGFEDVIKVRTADVVYRASRFVLVGLYLVLLASPSVLDLLKGILPGELRKLV